MVKGLARPSCLIIDGIGRCDFDLQNTSLFYIVGRNFDASTVFRFKRELYRSRNLKTVALITGRTIVIETADGRL